MKRLITQKMMVLDYLKSGKTINQHKCYMLFRATRLSAIIFNIKEMGYAIETERVLSPYSNTYYVNYNLKQ